MWWKYKDSSVSAKCAKCAIAKFRIRWKDRLVTSIFFIFYELSTLLTFLLSLIYTLGSFAPLIPLLSWSFFGSYIWLVFFSSFCSACISTFSKLLAALVFFTLLKCHQIRLMRKGCWVAISSLNNNFQLNQT